MHPLIALNKIDWSDCEGSMKQPNSLVQWLARHYRESTISYFMGYLCQLKLFGDFY